MTVSLNPLIVWLQFLLSSGVFYSFIFIDFTHFLFFQLIHLSISEYFIVSLISDNSTSSLTYPVPNANIIELGTLALHYTVFQQYQPSFCTSNIPNISLLGTFNLWFSFLGILLCSDFYLAFFYLSFQCHLNTSLDRPFLTNS